MGSPNDGGDSDPEEESAGHVRQVLADGARRGLQPPDLLRLAAKAVRCRIVLEDEDGATLVACPAAAPQPVAGTGAPAATATTGDGRLVRLDRTGGAAPGDTHLAVALAEFLTGQGGDRPSQKERGAQRPSFDLERAALVDTVLSATESETDRSRAVRALGMRTDLELSLVAIAGPAHADVAGAATELLTGLDGRRRPALTLVGSTAAGILQAPAESVSWATSLRARLADVASSRSASFADLRVGVGRALPAMQARISWDQAMASLRFAGTPDIEPVADHEELGVLSLFAHFEPAALAAVPEVVAVNHYRASSTGAQDLAVVDVFCRTGSLRRAAAELHMHHSTVPPRIERVEHALGWDLSQSRQRLRARMTLIVCRLAGNDVGAPDSLA